MGGVSLGQAGAIAGHPDHAARMDGRTGYVRAAHTAALATGNTFTLEAWVKRATVGVSQGLFAKGNGSYQVFFDATDRLVLRQAGNADIVRSTVALTDRTAFHHLAVTKSGPAVRLYVDGVDRTGAVADRTIGDTTGALVIGAGAGYLNGTLDEVAVYAGALTAATIARHHAAGAG